MISLLAVVSISYCLTTYTYTNQINVLNLAPVWTKIFFTFSKNNKTLYLLREFDQFSEKKLKNFFLKFLKLVWANFLVKIFLPVTKF